MGGQADGWDGGDGDSSAEFALIHGKGLKRAIKHASSRVRKEGLGFGMSN